MNGDTPDPIEPDALARLKLTQALKRAKYAGTEQPMLRGKEICLIFEKTSTRTRCAFEVAAHDQGAHVTYLDPSGSQIGHKESMKDTARVLGRMFDAIEFRGSGQGAADQGEPSQGPPSSPGPGTPERAGASIDLVRACAAAATPLLGVCLGHQAIGVAFGATVDRAPELLHGKTSSVHHTNVGVLQGLPDPFTATRYHSLTILPESLPAELEATAHTRSGVIMAVRHRELPIHGVQFHPESILTTYGSAIIATFVRGLGL